MSAQTQHRTNATLDERMDATPGKVRNVKKRDVECCVVDVLQAALDSAMNLPWLNATHATMCLNPPGAFYMVSLNPSVAVSMVGVYSPCVMAPCV